MKVLAGQRGDKGLSSERSFSFYYDPHGLQKDYDVEPEIPVSHIPGIECNAVIVTEIAPAAHLPQSRNARHNAEA